MEIEAASAKKFKTSISSLSKAASLSLSTLNAPIVFDSSNIGVVISDLVSFLPAM